MADLSGSGDDRGRFDRLRDGGNRDRGQLILLTGFALAFTLVAVVLLLNTVIYTENVATRGGGDGPRDAIDFRQSARELLAESVVAENRIVAAADGSYSDVASAVRDDLDRVNELLGSWYLTDGNVAGVNRSATILDHGNLTRETNASDDLTGDSGSADWEVATNVSSSRNVQLTVNGTSLTGSSAANADANGVGLKINNTSASTSWTAWIYLNASTGNLAVAVSQDGGTPTHRCATTGTAPTVALTGETIGGDGCAGLEWARGVGSPYDIHLLGSNRGVGTFRMTLNPDPGLLGGVNDSEFDDPDGAEQYPAVYAVRAPIRFEGPGIVVEDTIRVAPGEDDD